jgi:hypothetical protein
VTEQRHPIGGERRTPPAPEIDIDIAKAHPARVHNYLAGGNVHFAADRAAVDEAVAVLPGGLDTARRAVRAMADFLGRAVQHLVAETDVRQFLKLGAAVPAGEDVHEIAQAAAPDTRVVYVGHDPTVLAHSHALRKPRPEGVTEYVHGHVRQVEQIMDEAGATLDLDRPVALLLPATLNFVPDQDEAEDIVARFLDGIATGSFLVLAHTSHSVGSIRMSEAAERFGKVIADPYTVRGEEEIARFFVGLELVDPGLVPIEEWRPPPAPEPDADAEGRRPVPIYGAVARKP